MSDLAIILVNWNTRQLTLDALRSLYDDVGAMDASVWVVDNASHDDSVSAIRAEFPATNIIENQSNLGFAAGNNTALRAIGFGQGTPTGDLPRAVYLLNTDTITHPDATQTLFNALFSLPDAGVVGARLTYADGGFQHSAFEFPGLLQLWIDLLPTPHRFYDSRLNGRYPRYLYGGNQPFRVGHTLGATMMIRSEVVGQTGMFDEQFVMYVEEVDWSWRIRRAGWEIYCVPSAHITHLEGQSTRQARPQSVINLWRGRLMLYDRYYPAWKAALARRIVRLGMRRTIRVLAHDETLSSKDRNAMRDAYQTIIELAR